MTATDLKAARKELILSACHDLGFHGLRSDPSAIAAVASMLVQASDLGGEVDAETITKLRAALQQIRAHGGAWEARIAREALGEHVDTVVEAGT